MINRIGGIKKIALGGNLHLGVEKSIMETISVADFTNVVQCSSIRVVMLVIRWLPLDSFGDIGSPASLN